MPGESGPLPRVACGGEVLSGFSCPVVEETRVPSSRLVVPAVGPDPSPESSLEQAPARSKTLSKAATRTVVVLP